MSEYVLVVDDEPLIHWFAARVRSEEGFPCWPSLSHPKLLWRRCGDASEVS
jgi:hypothetical protein